MIVLGDVETLRHQTGSTARVARHRTIAEGSGVCIQIARWIIRIVPITAIPLPVFGLELEYIL